jgi:hypothetical protein
MADSFPALSLRQTAASREMQFTSGRVTAGGRITRLAAADCEDYVCFMPERADLRTDLISVLALASGAAVIIPSLIVLLLSILAVFGIHF